MFSAGSRCSEEILISSFAQLQFFAQGIHRSRKVANRQIDLRQVVAQPSQFGLVEGKSIDHPKGATGKLRHPVRRSIKMCVRVHFVESIAGCHTAKRSRFQNGRSRFVEELLRMSDISRRCVCLLFGREGNVCSPSWATKRGWLPVGASRSSKRSKSLHSFPVL